MKNILEMKNEKITDKAFSQQLLISVASILLCLVALCSITYAWFSGEQKSVGNQIASGTFDLEVSVVKSASDTSEAKKMDVTKNGDRLICELPEKGVYIVTLTRVGGSTANGYCYVTVGMGDAQPTETIVDANAEGEVGSNPFTFTVTTDAATTVQFQPWWGIHTNPVIQNNGIAPVDVTEQAE